MDAVCCTSCGHLSSARDLVTGDDEGFAEFPCPHCGITARDIPFTPGERQDAFGDLAAVA